QLLDEGWYPIAPRYPRPGRVYTLQKTIFRLLSFYKFEIFYIYASSTNSPKSLTFVHTAASCRNFTVRRAEEWIVFTNVYLHVIRYIFDKFFPVPYRPHANVPHQATRLPNVNVF